MRKVFITQVPSRRDRAANMWVPIVDVSPAEEFGEVHVLLPAGAQFFAHNEVVRLMRERLAELDYQSDDYILPLGNPIIMAVACAIAARRSNGSLNILVWDKQTSRYIASEINGLQ